MAIPTVTSTSVYRVDNFLFYRSQTLPFNVDDPPLSTAVQAGRICLAIVWSCMFEVPS